MTADVEMKNSRFANMLRHHANKHQERANFYYSMMKAANDQRERMWYAERFRYWNNESKRYRARAEKYS